IIKMILDAVITITHRTGSSPISMSRTAPKETLFADNRNADRVASLPLTHAWIQIVTRAFSDPIESDPGSSFLFLRVFFMRTGIHFA
ncbi:hypothetical protein, partial [Rhodoblastus sp.]|uniref:hypothetical protein n=1 Tax=Rhodoblastus sp. TaxID=1962975 RepID=UPI003F9B35E8